MGSSPVSSVFYYKLILFFMEVKNLKQIDFVKVVRSIDLVVPSQEAKLSQSVNT
jgi:hypothetical protein